LKFGAGLQYLFPRKLDTNYDEKLSFLPVYITAQINPYRGFFIKGNLGKNIYCGVDERFLDDVSGGLYYAIGLGYEFSFGLIVELLTTNMNVPEYLEKASQVLTDIMADYIIQKTS